MPPSVTRGRRSTSPPGPEGPVGSEPHPKVRFRSTCRNALARVEPPPKRTLGLTPPAEADGAPRSVGLPSGPKSRGPTRTEAPLERRVVTLRRLPRRLGRSRTSARIDTVGHGKDSVPTAFSLGRLFATWPGPHHSLASERVRRKASEPTRSVLHPPSLHRCPSRRSGRDATRVTSGQRRLP